MTPSMLPRVGRGRKPGVFYNTGHGHLGWTLSAATARIVAESVAAELAPKRTVRTDAGRRLKIGRSASLPGTRVRKRGGGA